MRRSSSGAEKVTLSNVFLLYSSIQSIQVFRWQKLTDERHGILSRTRAFHAGEPTFALLEAHVDVTSNALAAVQMSDGTFDHVIDEQVFSAANVALERFVALLRLLHALLMLLRRFAEVT